MKFYHSLAIVAFLVAAGCDKEDPKPSETPEEVVTKEIVQALANEPGLSSFVEVFTKVNLAAEEVAGGITVFAPADGSSTGRTREDGVLTPEILRGHIVKGLIAAGQLEDGQVLEALNGNQLTVSVNGGEIRINGVLISVKDLVADGKYVVHKVEEIIKQVVSQPATLTVTVMNSIKWSLENPDGMPEAGAIVKVYASQQAYAEDDELFSAETDGSGKAVFSNAVAGKPYYIVAHKDDLSSIFYRSAEPVDGLFTGFIADGIFQTVEEIQTAAIQSDAAVGNIRWRDINGDGIINPSDAIALPYPAVVAASGTNEVEVLIGYNNNDQMFIRDGEDANNTLQAIRTMLDPFHKNLVMVDGMLSDDAECGAMGPVWCTLDDFTFTPAHQQITLIWNNAYDMIGRLNLIIRDVPDLEFEDRDRVLAEAKGIRGYLYTQLATYFGDVPLLTSYALTEDDWRALRSEVYAQAENDLVFAIENLPVMPSESREVLTADAARLLLARVLLYLEKFDEAVTLTDDIMQAGRFALSGLPEDPFTFRSNSEVMWDFSFNVSPQFSSYFYGRSICPALRFAEVYLINAEAKFRSGDPDPFTLEVLRSRRGMGPIAGPDTNSLLAALMETWKAEKSREGDRYANIIRWNNIPGSLITSGFDTYKHRLLPIPQVVLDKYPLIMQNPGY